MFGKNENEYEQPKSSGETETIIGPSVKVKGNFVGEGNVTIEGEVEGTFETKNDLRIGRKAVIRASVKAKNVFVAGKVEGNIKSFEKTKLAATAKVFGDIETKHLCVESGAIFNGKCAMKGEGKEEAKEHHKEEVKLGPPPIK